MARAFQPVSAANPGGYQPSPSTESRDREFKLLKDAVDGTSGDIPGGLVVDGDGDGIATVDIGAYEFDPVPPVADDDSYTVDEDNTLTVPAPGVLAKLGEKSRAIQAMYSRDKAGEVVTRSYESLSASNGEAR